MLPEIRPNVSEFVSFVMLCTHVTVTNTEGGLRMCEVESAGERLKEAANRINETRILLREKKI